MIRLKICIVNHDFSLGGVQRVAVELARGLSTIANYELYLFDFLGKDDVFYDIEPGVCMLNNVRGRKMSERVLSKVLNFRYKITRKPYKLELCMKNLLIGLCESIEMNQFDCLILCQGLLTALIPSLKKVYPYLKIIAWQHSDYEAYKKYYAAFLADYFIGLAKADVVVCLTEYSFQYYKEHNDNTVFIYNPLTLHHQEISDLESNKVIFVGRMEVEPKGLDFLVDIAERTSNKWQFLLAGAGKDESNIRKVIRLRGLEDKVILVGALRDDDLKDHYLKGAVYASTSRWEGFGLVLLEAMSCGLPIVAFDIPSTREMLNDSQCGMLVEKYDLEQFANAIDRLMVDKSLREYYQKKGLERVKDFSINQIVKEWQSLVGK